MRKGGAGSFKTNTVIFMLQTIEKTIWRFDSSITILKMVGWSLGLKSGLKHFIIHLLMFAHKFQIILNFLYAYQPVSWITSPLKSGQIGIVIKFNQYSNISSS